jgi:hypothetical protein
VDTPDWRDTQLSGIKRVALWLHSEVTPGGTFTKQQMRAALSTPLKDEQDEQLDRRMRDLRPEGWKITTYREDRELTQKELRLVEEGGAIWVPGYQSRRQKVPTAAQRTAAFAADDYRCRFCGIGAGEAYPEDALGTSTLTISQGASGLVTCCDRCRSGRPTLGSAEDLISQACQLSSDDLDSLKKWIREGRREVDAPTRMWTNYNQLPPDQRVEFEEKLRSI